MIEKFKKLKTKLNVILYIELKNVHVIEWLIVSVLGLPQHYALWNILT